MQKTNKKQIKTTIKQKIGLILFGILLALIILESGLRVGGFVVSSYQRTRNKEAFNADYRILCLGESTTGRGNEYSWPSQLEIILNNRSSGTKFKVFNEGIGGTNTAFILSQLKNNLNQYKPDMVVTMMGINDNGLIKYEENLKVKIIFILRDLRVYKLGRILSEAWKNKIQGINTNDIIKEPDPNKFFEEGEKYLSEGYIKRAEKMFVMSLEKNPNNWQTYMHLGFIYVKINDTQRAEKMFVKSLEINEKNAGVCAWLGEIYLNQNKLKDAEKLLKRSIEIEPKNEESYNQLCLVYKIMGISNKEIEEFLYTKERTLFKVQDTYDLSTTKYHHQQLYKKLNKRGMKYIAMQYPTLNIDELKNMFEGNEDIIFISNEENFKKALETGKYEDYFIDSFRESFGHATLKGNKLIAENVANVILKNLEIEN